MNKNLFIKTLRSAMKRNGHTQDQVACMLKITQSQVSKVLNGDFSREGHVVKKLKVYSKYNEFNDKEIVSREINKAVAEVWDGTERMEKQIAGIIRGVGNVLTFDKSV